MTSEEGGATSERLSLDGIKHRMKNRKYETLVETTCCFLPEVWEEASCCITAVPLDDGPRGSEVRRLLDAEQPADSTKNLQHFWETF